MRSRSNSTSLIQFLSGLLPRPSKGFLPESHLPESQSQLSKASAKYLWPCSRLACTCCSVSGARAGRIVQACRVEWISTHSGRATIFLNRQKGGHAGGATTSRAVYTEGCLRGHPPRGPGKCKTGRQQYRLSNAAWRRLEAGPGTGRNGFSVPRVAACGSARCSPSTRSSSTTAIQALTSVRFFPQNENTWDESAWDEGTWIAPGRHDEPGPQ